MIRFVLCVFTLFVSHSVHVVANDWPQFRGPDGTGHARANNLPAQWSETENIQWKTFIPGKGFSSPVVAGNKIWLTTALKEGRLLCAVCVDIISGEIVRQVELFHIEKPGKLHAKNSYATPTPAIENGNVYLHFGAIGTAALSSDGEVIWKNTSLAHYQPYSSASSPIVFDALLIINCDGTDHQFVVALDRRTGKILWKTARDHLEAARNSPSASRYPEKGFTLMSYGTPTVVDVDGAPQLVSTAADHVAAYDLRNGEEIWWLGYKGFSTVGVPVSAHGLIFAQGFEGVGRPATFAIRTGGRGDIAETHLAWKVTKGAPHVPSLLVVEDEIYMVGDKGVMSCLDAKTGELHWQQRLGDNYSASPIYADGKIYVCSEGGKTTVLMPGREFKQIATSQLNGKLMASPCVLDDALLLRTDSHLYRIQTASRKSP